jgi:hypothetical protein
MDYAITALSDHTGAEIREAEALALLADLLEHSTQAKYQYWRPGTW